jgi:dihydrofolate reductase
VRKVNLFMMVSLDGYFEGPGHDLSWHNVDSEFNEFAVKQLESTGTLLFGRATYQLMAGYWPTEAAKKDDPVVAGLMNSAEKLVASRTLEGVSWENSSLIRGDVCEAVAGLKGGQGKDIAIFGSNNLCVSLMEKGLVDEFRIMVNPVAIGGGTPLFKGTKGKIGLKLEDVRQFRSGNVLLRYTALRSPP